MASRYAIVYACVQIQTSIKYMYRNSLIIYLKLQLLHMSTISISAVNCPAISNSLRYSYDIVLRTYGTNVTVTCSPGYYTEEGE